MVNRNPVSRFLQETGFLDLAEVTRFLGFSIPWTIAGEASVDRPPSSAITKDAELIDYF